MGIGESSREKSWVLETQRDVNCKSQEEETSTVKSREEGRIRPVFQTDGPKKNFFALASKSVL